MSAETRLKATSKTGDDHSYVAKTGDKNRRCHVMTQMTANYAVKRSKIVIRLCFVVDARSGCMYPV